jgi:hypothetical protein
MSKKLINFRLPDDLIAALDNRAKEQATTRTNLVENLLRQGLELQVNHESFTNSSTVNQDIKQEVNQLIQAAITPIQQRVSELEHRLGELAA